MKKVKLGRLGWKEASHERWTFAAAERSERFGWCLSRPTGEPVRAFGSVEMWAPGWTQCAERDLAPDVFFAAHNPAMSAVRSLDFVALLAVAVDLGDDAAALGRACPPAIGGETVVHRRRPWARSIGRGFTDSLQDLMPFGAFARTWERASSAVELAEGWDVVQGRGH
jgi:hypothetical protein